MKKENEILLFCMGICKNTAKMQVVMQKQTDWAPCGLYVDVV